MSIELSLLGLFCSDRQVHGKFSGYIKTLNNMEREIKLLFSLVGQYYKEFEKDSLNRDELLSYYDLKYPNAKDAEFHINLMNQAFDLDVSPELVKLQLDQLIERHHAAKVVNKLLPVLEGDKFGVLDSVPSDVSNYVELLSNPPDRLVVPEPCELSVAELIKTEIDNPGVPWPIKAVNDIIGGVRRKTLGLIYAYVDSGKTSFAMFSVAHFAQQLVETEETICYCGNEEAAGRLRLRLVQAILGCTRSQVKENGHRAEEMAQAGGINQVKVFDSITSTEQLDYIAKEYHPTIVILDQATGIQPPGKAREGVDRLEVLFPWYRKFAVSNDLAIIGVAQGDKAAENTKYLKLSDMYGSKVSMQAALDWTIGIGRKVNDPIDEAHRYLNIPKNKLANGDDGKILVNFNKYQCSWRAV